MTDFFNRITNLAIERRFVKNIILVTLATVVIVWGLTVVFFVSQLNNANNTIYLIDNSSGAISTAHTTTLQSVRGIEAIAHTQLFLRYFFEVNKSNYLQNINTAMDLGGSCIVKLYNNLESNGWTKDIVPHNIIQTVNIINSEVVAEAPFVVDTHFTVKIESETLQTTTYDIEMSFTLRDRGGLTRSIENPHDMSIEDIELKKWTTN